MIGSPRSIKDLGRLVIQSSSADPKFSLRLGDCAVRVVLDEMFALSAAATLRYRSQRDAPELFKEYGVSTEKRVGISLSKALDERFRKHAAEKCKELTDNAEKARRAMQEALTNMLSPDATPDAFMKMSANQIHDALRKTNSMSIVRQFYASYLFNVLAFVISSLHAEIPPAAEKAVMASLRTTYCDDVAKRIVARAKEKGWLPSQIPEKVKEWQDLLVQEKKVHA